MASLGLCCSVQSLSHVQLFETPWTAARQASLTVTNSRSLLKLVSSESVMPSNHLILCCSLLLLPSIFPSIRIFSNKSALRIRWPKYWSFNFSISPANEYSGFISFGINSWSPFSPWDSEESFPAPHFEVISPHYKIVDTLECIKSKTLKQDQQWHVLWDCHMLTAAELFIHAYSGNLGSLVWD